MLWWGKCWGLELSLLALVVLDMLLVGLVKGVFVFVEAFAGGLKGGAGVGLEKCGEVG